MNVGSLIIALRSGRYLQVQTSSKSSFWKELVCWSGTFSSLLNPFVFAFDGSVVGSRLR